MRLTSHEFRVLSYLMHHRGRIVSQRELTEHIYAQDVDRDSNTVEVFIARLRRKLGPSYIETFAGSAIGSSEADRDMRSLRGRVMLGAALWTIGLLAVVAVVLNVWRGARRDDRSSSISTVSVMRRAGRRLHGGWAHRRSRPRRRSTRCGAGSRTCARGVTVSVDGRLSQRGAAARGRFQRAARRTATQRVTARDRQGGRSRARAQDAARGPVATRRIASRPEAIRIWPRSSHSRYR